MSTELKSPDRNPKPLNWPKGIAVGMFPTFNGEYTCLSFMVRTGEKGVTRFPFLKENYTKVRKKALAHLAKRNGFKKIPSTWSVVQKDHDAMCKAYSFKPIMVKLATYERIER